MSDFTCKPTDLELFEYGKEAFTLVTTEDELPDQASVVLIVPYGGIHRALKVSRYRGSDEITVQPGTVGFYPVYEDAAASEEERACALAFPGLSEYLEAALADD